MIKSTIEEDIRFITLPPNATHLCQPLDVAVFRGLKRTWRSIIDSWRKETRLKGVIPKEHLSSLLCRLTSSLTGDSLISGFRATGIHPLNRDEVLKRLPDQIF